MASGMLQCSGAMDSFQPRCFSVTQILSWSLILNIPVEGIQCIVLATRDNGHFKLIHSLSRGLRNAVPVLYAGFDALTTPLAKLSLRKKQSQRGFPFT